MAERVASLYAEVSADTTKLDKGLKGAKKSIEQAGASLKSLNKIAKDASIVLAGAGVAIDKAFEFGRMGASAAQLEKSFATLLGTIGAAPDTLDQLREASKGTISEFDMMASTSVLLAATSGDLATALASSAPRLMEIAKAAAKLNPSLGDTTYMYDSLARGIKRASPLILDNLGILVKVEDANQKYAASIGKSADALTAEEQKIALLNAVLEQGNTLITQAGGNTDSATDAFDRMNASVTNLKNTLAEGLAPTLSKAADGLNWLLTMGSFQDQILAETNKQVAKTSVSYDQYVDRMLDAAIRAGQLTEQSKNLVKQTVASGVAVKDASNGWVQYSQAEFEAGLGLNVVADAQAAAGDSGEVFYQSLGRNAEALNGVTVANGMYSSSLETVETTANSAALKVQTLSAEELAAAINAQRAAEAAANMFDVMSSNADIGSPLKNFISDLQFFAASGGADFIGAFENIKAALQQGLITPEQAQAAAGELLVAYEGTLASMGEQTGADAAANISAALKIPVEEATVKLGEYGSALDAVANVKRTIVIDVELTGDIWALGLSGGNLYAGASASGGMSEDYSGVPNSDDPFAGWYAQGGSFEVDQPTLFGAGEGATPETVTITPNDGSGNYSRNSQSTINIYLSGGAGVNDATDIARQIERVQRRGI